MDIVDENPILKVVTPFPLHAGYPRTGEGALLRRAGSMYLEPNSAYKLVVSFDRLW